MPARNKGKHKPWVILVWIAAVAIAFLAIAFAATRWHIPTRIQADLFVDRVEFAPANQEPIRILDRATSFHKLTIENFSQVSFAPEALELTDLPELRPQERAALVRAMRQGGEVVLQGEPNRRSAIRIEAAKQQTGSTGRLESISIKPDATVIFEAHQGTAKAFTLQLTATEFAPDIFPAGVFKLTAVHVTNPALEAARIHPAAIAMQVTLRQDSPYLKVNTESEAFIATLSPSTDNPVDFLIKGGVPLHRIQFTKQNHGDIETSLAGPGKITYMDFPNIEPVTVEAHQLINLGRLTAASIRQLRYDPQQAGFHVRIEGEAGEILIRSGAFTQDYRLSLFDRTWRDNRIISIFAALGSLCVILVMIFQYYGASSKR